MKVSKLLFITLQKKSKKKFFKAACHPLLYNLLGRRGFESSALPTCNQRCCFNGQNGKNQGTPRLARCKLKQQAMVYEVVYHRTNSNHIGEISYVKRSEERRVGKEGS